MGAVLSACPPWAQNVILAGYRGSESHGTTIREGDRATDDVDVFTITVQPPAWYCGLTGYSNSSRQVFETAGDDLDILAYDVRKFFSLLAKGNPNVLSYLWLNPEHVLRSTPAGKLIVESRDLFLSRHILDGLGGYARAEAKKMLGTQLYQGYMGEKRKALVDKFGYDIKNAAHCVRLLYLGIELCSAGTLYAYRPESEREEMIAIKRGEWLLEKVTSRIDELWEIFSGMEASAPLPNDVDYDAINALLVKVINDSFLEKPLFRSAIERL